MTMTEPDDQTMAHLMAIRTSCDAYHEAWMQEDYERAMRVAKGISDEYERLQAKLEMDGEP